MLSVIRLNLVTLIVVMASVVMLNVAALAKILDGTRVEEKGHLGPML
jgi:hypothetical protein